MIPLSSSPVRPPTIEQGIHSLVNDAKRKLQDSCEDCRQCVRESPMQAILLAAAAGYLLHRLPVRALLVAKVRLITALTPPTLLAYGAAKLCEILQDQAREKLPAVPRPPQSESTGTSH
jgi:ferredoxin